MAQKCEALMEQQFIRTRNGTSLVMHSYDTVIARLGRVRFRRCEVLVLVLL